MRWLLPLFRRSAIEEEMDAELRFHFEELVRELTEQGCSREEAIRQARLELGGLGQIKDEIRDTRLAGPLESLARGLRMAARTLARDPKFALVAITTLALGIGANTVMFSAFDQAILRNLEVQEPARLVAFRSFGPTPGMEMNSGRKMSFSYPMYLDFRDRRELFDGVLARCQMSGSVQYRGATDPVDIELVSGNYFHVLGVRAAVGRLLTPEDDQHPMNDPVAVLSYLYWQTRFGGDPSIVGRKVTINGMGMTVVGVSANGFHGLERGQDQEVRVPMTMKDLFTPTWRGGRDRRFWAWLNIVARVKPGISQKQAETGANVFYRQILADEARNLPKGAENMREDFLKRRLDLLPSGGGLAGNGENRKTFLIELSALAGLVLLIACVNLAGLLVARTGVRRREFAIRMTLGAGRLGVVRLILMENLLLAIAGGALAMLLTVVLGKPAMALILSDDAAVLYSTTPDIRVALFAIGVTVLGMAGISLAPALEARRAQLADVLKSGSGASAGHAQVRVRKALVTAQVMLCIWLLMAAGLFARTLANLRAVDLGFEKRNLVTFGIDPTITGLKMDAAVAVCRRLEAALSAIPGVRSVSFSNFGEATRGMNGQLVSVPGYIARRPDDAMAAELSVTPAHLQTLGLHLLAGRAFVEADRRAIRTTIINEAFAKHFFGGRSPVGQMIRDEGAGLGPLEVIGVVQNQLFWGPRDEPQPAFYIPFDFPAAVSFYVRTSARAEGMLETIRKTVERQAAGVPIMHLNTMEEALDLQLGAEMQMTRLAGVFGLLAIVLAAIGLYGVIAYTVARRTREIGVRIALGATRGAVLRMILRDVAIVIAVGLAFGIPTGVALARLVRSQLWNVGATDPWVLCDAVVTVAAATLIAGLLPAMKATRIEPTAALRWE